jgi:RNA polymerase sigma-70 factor (ECF subfamily)
MEMGGNSPSEHCPSADARFVRCDGESVDAVLDCRHGETVPARIKVFADGNELDPKSVYLGVPGRIVESAPVGHPEDERLEVERVGLEQAILPHLDAAYSLARWLTANEQDAEDVLQEACLRAVRFFPGYQGGSPRAWLLAIVRRTCYTWLAKNRAHQSTTIAFDDELHSGGSETTDPEALLLRQADREMLRQGLAELPVEFREVIVLREFEQLSYKEIAAVAEIPVGTVMSRLARGRQQLQQGIAARMGEESDGGL